MLPENLSTIENSHQSDWWVSEKMSQNKAFLNFKKNHSFRNPFDTDRWWGIFDISSIVILILLILSITLVYQNRNVFAKTFPNTVAAIQKINIFPDIFKKIRVDLETRYSLSSLLISLESQKYDSQTAVTIGENQIGEKPLKILISKIGVDSAVANPLSNNISTLNNALKLGAVRYPDSGFLDEDKNIFIFGHSTSLETNTVYYKTFNNLNKLVVGDEIILRSAENEYIYKVASVSITNTEDGLISFGNDKELILSTCNTLGQKEERIIVNATFVKKRSLVNGTITTNPVTPIAGEQTNSVYEVAGTPAIMPLNGLIDFQVTIDAIGILNSDNQFVASSTPSVREKIAVKFTVKNIGNKKSENWYFNAVIPTSPAHIFHSKSQQALAPGEKIEFTMGFDKPKIGENQLVIINVDPSGGIKESDKTNNITKKFVTIVE